MKKVGIITFHRSHNCGSILQSYAMQRILMDYGLRPEFIDFSNKGQRDLYSVFRRPNYGSFRKFAKSMYKNTLGLILYRRAKQNWTSYDNYIATHLHLSKHNYKNSLELIEDKMPYDIYLTGSDQVWNVKIDDYDAAYFLDFVSKHKKVAYAVSQGAKDIGKYANNPNVIKRLIKSIDYVSTREQNGQKWLEKLTGNRYPVVLDPTLLHEQSAYTSIEENHGMRGIKYNEYIFIYATPLSRKYLKQIKEYAKNNNLKIVIWHTDIWLKRLGWLKGIKCPKHQNPGQYLDLIKNAKYVCTSSFHGVAFSTIYRKNFVVLENDGMRAGDDDRMTGFLHKLKLSDRIVDHSRFNVKMSQDVNYTMFEKELANQQKISHEFLNRALNTPIKVDYE